MTNAWETARAEITCTVRVQGFDAFRRGESILTDQNDPDDPRFVAGWFMAYAMAYGEGVKASVVHGADLDGHCPYPQFSTAWEAWAQGADDENDLNPGEALVRASGWSPALEKLSAAYIKWCDEQGLPKMSADELICEDLTDAQRKWVSAFIQVWEAEDERA